MPTLSRLAGVLLVSMFLAVSADEAPAAGQELSRDLAIGRAAHYLGIDVPASNVVAGPVAADCPALPPNTRGRAWKVSFKTISLTATNPRSEWEEPLRLRLTDADVYLTDAGPASVAFDVNHPPERPGKRDPESTATPAAPAWADAAGRLGLSPAMAPPAIRLAEILRRRPPSLFGRFVAYYGAVPDGAGELRRCWAWMETPGNWPGARSTQFAEVLRVESAEVDSVLRSAARLASSGATVRITARLPDRQTSWTNAMVRFHRVGVLDAPEELALPLRGPDLAVDARGVVTLQSVQPGEYRVQARSGFAMRTVPLTVSAEQAEAEVALVMSPLVLEGSVRDSANDAGVAGKSLCLTRTVYDARGGVTGHDLDSTVSGEDGTFRFDGLEEGTYDLKCGSEKTKVTMSPTSAVTRVTIALYPHAVSGVVIRPNGEPAAGAEIVLMQGHDLLMDQPGGTAPTDRATRSNEKGEFHFDHLAHGSYTIFARSREGECRMGRIGVHPGSDTCRLALTREAISGRVLWADGETPVTNAVVYVGPETPNRQGMDFWYDGRVDPNGSFFLPGCDSATYHLWTEVPEEERPYTEVLAKANVTVASNKTAFVELVEPGAAIRGA